jgi:IS5 family transposase
MEGLMPRRRIGQLSWVDGALSKRQERRRDVLSEIAALVDWAPFAQALNGIHRGAKGEASYPPLAMFKVLLLQRWYGLSDPAMEAALFDRISFLRFAGFATEDETPDHATIWRFREALGQDGLIERLFGELARQLDGRGVTVRQGTLIDASIVQSAARRPRMDESRVSPTDPDARFGTSNERGRFTFGYKMHVAVDAGSTLVRAWQVTPANLQEVTVAPSLLPEAAGMVYADRGYDSGPLRSELARRGFGDGVMRRGNKHHALAPAEQERNHALALRRRPVEAVFGTLKRCYGFHRMRYFAARRNAVAVALACIGFNLRRWRVCATG